MQSHHLSLFLILFNTEMLLVLFHRMMPIPKSSSSSSSSSHHVSRTVRLGEPFSDLVCAVCSWIEILQQQQEDENNNVINDNSNTSEETKKRMIEESKSILLSSSTLDSSSFVEKIVIPSYQKIINDIGIKFVQIDPEHQEKLLFLVIEQAKTVLLLIRICSSRNHQTTGTDNQQQETTPDQTAVTCRIQCLISLLRSLSSTAGSSKTAPDHNDVDQEKEKRMRRATQKRDDAVACLERLLSSAVLNSSSSPPSSSLIELLSKSAAVRNNEARVSLLQDLGLQPFPSSSIFNVNNQKTQHQQQSCSDLLYLSKKSQLENILKSSEHRGFLTINNDQHENVLKVLLCLVQMKQNNNNKNNNTSQKPVVYQISLDAWKSFLMCDWIGLRTLGNAISKVLDVSEESQKEGKEQVVVQKIATSAQRVESKAMTTTKSTGDYLLSLMDQK